MKNTLGDLNNHLFAQLERLGDEEINGDELKEEIMRASAVAGIAARIIENGALVLKAKQFEDGMLEENKKIPKMLEG